MIFSVIIPIYRGSVERNFIRCLKSIKNNTFDKNKFEVIIVNDGMKSIRNYKILIKDILIQSNIHVKIVSNDINMGQSYSRYVGLKESKGKYVHFVDGDDEIFPNIYLKLNEYLNDDPNFVLFMEDNATFHLDQISQEEVFDILTTGKSSDELKNITFDKKDVKKLRHYYMISLHSKIFNRKWLFDNTELWIPNLLSFEDFLITIEVLTKTDKFKLCPEKFYKYYFLIGYTDNHTNFKFFFDFIFSFNKALDLIYPETWDLRHFILSLMMRFYSFYYEKDSEYSDFFIKNIIKKYDYINFEFFNKNEYKLFKNDAKLYKLFAPLILSNSDKFFQKMLNIDTESIIEPDINQKLNKEINTIEFSLNDANLSYNLQKYNPDFNYLKLNSSDSIKDTLFLSAILLLLTKFNYSHGVLISKIVENKDISKENKSSSSGKENINKILCGLKIDSSQTVESFLYKIKELNINIERYSSFFNRFKELNELNMPDFQYFYKTQNKNTGIPKSDFSIIIEDLNNKNSKNKNNENNNNLSIDLENIKVKIIYDSSLYSDKLVHLFYNSFILILNKILNDKNNIIKNIGINDNDKFPVANFKPIPFESIVEMFESVVTENMDKIALIDDIGSIDYNFLNQKVNIVANNLIKKGLSIGDRVIIDLSRDNNLIISILAVIKSGGIFVLSNPKSSIGRKNILKKDINPKFILSNTWGNDINLDILSLLNGSNINNPNLKLNKKDVFSIVYTSGTTGIPKGVMLTHEGVLNGLTNHKDNILIHTMKNNNVDIALLIAPVVFVGFISNLFSPISAGSTVVICDDEIVKNPMEIYKLFKKTNFNQLTLIPSAIEIYLQIPPLCEILNKLKVICVSGEKFNIDFVKRLKKVTNAELLNIYGLTESSGMASIKKLEPNEEVTLGKPQLNLVEKIMDIDNNPLPNGLIGEVWFGGLGVAKGYWGNDQLTNEKFTNINGISYFKSGDLVKRDENNELIMISRADEQIKLRGQRIEPGEIENNVPFNLGITHKVVNVKKINNENVLCLYFTTNNKLSKMEINQIKKSIDQELKNKLPIFMIPQFYVYLDEFHFTQSGKINKKELPDPKKTDIFSGDLIHPRSNLEKEIFNLATEILGNNNFGIDTNLLNAGFTSLSLVKLSSKIYERYKIEIKLLDLFEKNGNIINICEEIENSIKKSFIKHPIHEIYPLTSQQSFLYRIQQTMGIYNGVCFYVEFNNEFDIDKLKEALLKTIEINSYIKTSFTEIKGEVYQKRNDSIDIPISIYNKQVNEDIIKEFDKPFNIFEDVLCRFNLYCHENEIILLMGLHHLIFDMMSIHIFLDDLFEIYKNNTDVIKEFDYFDYSLDILENNNLLNVSNSDYEKELSFNVSDKISDINLSKYQYLILNSKDYINFCKMHNILLSDLILASIALSLNKLLKIEDLLILYVFYGRNNPQYYNTMGFFVEFVPMLINTEYNSIKDYLYYIKNNIISSIDNPSSSDFIFEKKISPLIFYNYSEYYSKNNINQSLITFISDSNNFNMNKNEMINNIDFRVTLTDNELVILLSYNLAYYSDDMMDFLLKNIDLCLKKIIKHVENNETILLGEGEYNWF
ncbi:MAG: non-ribosomal peptide synthetase partial [Methanobrevibacter sp. CfCl-M3]